MGQVLCSHNREINMSIPPSPELLRKFRNTREIVESGRAYLVPSLVASHPNDYVDLFTYESIKKAMQLM